MGGNLKGRSPFRFTSGEGLVVPTENGVEYRTPVFIVEGGDISKKGELPHGHLVASPQFARERLPKPSIVDDAGYHPLESSDEWFRTLWITTNQLSSISLGDLLGDAETQNGDGDCGCTCKSPPTRIRRIDEANNREEAGTYHVLAARFTANVKLETGDTLPRLEVLYQELWLSEGPWDLTKCGELVARALYTSTIARLFCRMRHLKGLGHPVPPLEDLIRLVRL